MKAEIVAYKGSSRLFTEEISARAKETVASMLRRAATNAHKLVESDQRVTSFEIKVCLEEVTHDA